jgi:copper transport protein
MWRSRSVWALLLVLVAVLADVRQVLAHPKVLETVPAENAQLDVAPAEARIVFDEPLEEALSQIVLYDARRQQIGITGGRLTEQPTVLALPLPPLEPGVYTVVWQTVGADGHPIKGNFAFSVRDTAPTAMTVPQVPAAETPLTATSVVATPTAEPAIAAPPATAFDEAAETLLAPVLLRALMLLGSLAALGGAATTVLVLKPAIPVGSETVSRRSRRIIIVSLMLLLIGVVGMLAVHTLRATSALTPQNLIIVMTATRFGQALLGRLVLAIALLTLMLMPRRDAPWHQALTALLGAALLLTFALAGHAAGQEQSLLPILADWLHLAASALWVGGLLLLTLILPTILKHLTLEQRIAALAGVIQRFSPLALQSVLILVTTGTYAMLLHLSTPSELWTSAYGQALLAKLLLFGTLLLLGAYQLLAVRPRFIAWTERIAEILLIARWQWRFVRILRGEAVLALLLLVATGLLTSLAPPGAASARSTPSSVPPSVVSQAAVTTSAEPTQPPATLAPTRTPVPSRPFTQTQTVADLDLTLAVQPASINENRFLVEVRDQNGQPLEVQLVRVTAEMLEMDMGTRQLELLSQGGGRYSAEAPRLLSMVGDWQLRVLVRRVDADDVEVSFAVPVGE